MKHHSRQRRGRLRFLRTALPILAIISTIFPILVHETTQFGRFSQDSGYEMFQKPYRINRVRGTDLISKTKDDTKPWQKHYPVHTGTIQDWSNDRDIVHVIYTNFMQHQPNLLELGLARMQLFKTICLPTIKKQTNQQFLWIIRTDPGLHPTLKRELLEELQNVPNVAVVGSNEIRKGSVDEGFRGKTAIADITSYSLFLGNMDLVQSFHQEAQTNTVLETNLDIDDGLGLTFVETAQNLTEARFRGNKRKTAWFNLCVGRHLEWQYYAPWDHMTDKGALTLGSTDICVTAGLSHATMVKADPEFTKAHQLIKQETKDCKTIKRAYLGCWEGLPDNEHLAIYARTPTSTGMERVLTLESEWTQDQRNADASFWPLLTNSFDISQAGIKTAHRYLKDHMEEVVTDNLRGQCQKDHSCSEGIKKKLKNILYGNDFWKNKFDMVHVIQTSLDSSLSFHVLRQFSFDSLEAQTSYEFLWIIRVKGLSESMELDDFVTSQVFGRSPLNILVVQSGQTSTVNFRAPEAIADITEDTLLYGDIALLMAFHEAAQNRTVLETSLEPYHALSTIFIEEMQRSTVTQLERSQLMDEENVWYYRCTSKYIKWNYFTPEGYERDSGFLSLAGTDNALCLENPGATRISLPGAQITYYSKLEQISECQVLGVLRIKSGCYAPIFTNKTLTATAIIPESIEKTVPKQVDAREIELLDEDDKHLRIILRDSLKIRPKSIETMRLYMQQTQCSDSLTCNTDWNSEHGVTHVIQTSLRDKSDFLYWRYFCLSLESQTSNKFLWIIRVSPDSGLIPKLMKTVQNISLNVIVVRSSFRPSVSFKHPQAIQDIKNETLAYGNITMLEYFHLNAQRRPLLETFLEPTEGLSKEFVAKIQEVAAFQAKKSGSVGNRDSWYYRCVSEFIEWSSHVPDSVKIEAGMVQKVSAETETCINRPGTTRISLPGSNIPPEDAEGSLCNEANGWFRNGCFVPTKGGISAARVVTTKSRVQQEKVDEFMNASAIEEEQRQWYDSLREEFGIYRMSLLQLIFKMNEKGSSSASLAWENDKNIVHVIYSRFMQQQGTLLQLGMARLKLFKALCMPTIFEQTNKQFLWVIRTDHELLEELKDDLIESLKELPNVVLVASDVGADGFSNGSFRKDSALDEFTGDTVLLGDLNLLRSYHKASKEHALIETNLDTDDGISLTFVATVQSQVNLLLAMDKQDEGWFQICISRHMEWHVYSPWEKKSKKGCMLPAKGRSCIKSGLSWATQPNASPKFSKALHDLKEYQPYCIIGNSTETSLFKGCWGHLRRSDPNNDVVAIRAMSPASSGLAKGRISSFDWGIKSLFFDKIAWSFLDPYFSIRPAIIKDIRNYLVENEEKIIADNERSKCTHERTCAGKWKNKHRVVHVVFTDIQDPNLADPWHRVSLSSLTRQSSYEFLWIIRVADFMDARIAISILQPMKESPFVHNIIVVKSSGLSTESFGSLKAMASIPEDSLVQGNMNLLHDYYKAAQTRPLLETYLKPTEGLTRTYMEEIQLSASTWAQRRDIHGGGMWYYQCVPVYIETTYRTPWGDSVEDVFLRDIGRNESNCMNRPGTTRVTLPGSKIGQDVNMEIVQECSQDNITFRNGCFIEVEAPKTPALRFLLPNEVQKPTVMTDSEMVVLKAQQLQFVMQLRLSYSVFPPSQTSMKKLIWDNERKIIHVVHTWITEPSSIITWRQFCIDSLIKQSNQNFLWVIRTNITGVEDIKDISYPIKFFFGDPENIFLVRSSNPTTIDFRKPEALADVSEGTLLRGEIDSLRDAQKAAQGRTVIETYLSPTDSLSTGFMRDLHTSVESDSQANNWVGHQVTSYDKTNKKDLWYFHCAEEHIEWNFFAPQGETRKVGFLRLAKSKSTACLSNPGASRISLPGSEVTDEVILSDIQNCTSEKHNGCYVPLSSDHTLTARAEIPMLYDKDLVAHGKNDEKPQMTNQKELLNVLNNDYGLKSNAIEIMRTRLQKIKCREENSCTNRWESKFGVVHIMYTSLQDPLMVAIWRRFSFALEKQTSNGFLWIIRVSPDREVLNEVVKPCIKTPLNVIVAKSSNDTVRLYDFRRPEALLDLNAETIQSLNGDELEMLKYFHERAQSSPLLETFLQPTDALKNTFVRDIQNFTINRMNKNMTHDQETSPIKSWYYQCVPSHWEWTYFAPDGNDPDHGFLGAANEDTIQCMDRPGKTRVSLPGSRVDTSFQATEVCVDSSNTNNGCYIPMNLSKIENLAARVVIPKSVHIPPFKRLDPTEIASSHQLVNVRKEFKQDFSVPPLFLKQMKEHIKNAFDKESK